MHALNLTHLCKPWWPVQTFSSLQVLDSVSSTNLLSSLHCPPVNGFTGTVMPLLHM